MCHDATRWLAAQPRRWVIEMFGGSWMRATNGKPPASGRAAQAKPKPHSLKAPQPVRYRELMRGRSKTSEAPAANHRSALAASGRTAHGKGCAALVRNTHNWLVSPVFRQTEELRLTFELSGRQRQDARPGPVKTYRVPPARAWWPAVVAPLERGVRPHRAHRASESNGAAFLPRGSSSKNTNTVGVLSPFQRS